MSAPATQTISAQNEQPPKKEKPQKEKAPAAAADATATDAPADARVGATDAPRAQTQDDTNASPETPPKPKRGRPKKEKTPEEIEAQKERRRAADRERKRRKAAEKKAAREGPSFGNVPPPPPPGQPAPDVLPPEATAGGAAGEQQSGAQGPPAGLPVEAVATMMVELLDLGAQTVGNMAFDGRGAELAADDPSKAMMTSAATEYLKTADWNLTPGQMFLATVAMVYLPAAARVSATEVPSGGQ